MAKRRIPLWLLLVAAVLMLPVAAILTLWAYKTITAPTLHPDPQHIPSSTGPIPSAAHADAANRARQIVRQALIDQNLPGMSVAVGVDDRIEWAEGFGWANVDNHVAVEPATLFRVGDASKVLTSAAVGTLLEKNAVHLDDEIQNYVPEFPKKPWPVRLRQLMADTAGVTTDHDGEAPLSNPPSGEGAVARNCEVTVDGLHLDNFATRDLLFEPGTSYQSSTYGWVLVSAAIEAAAHQSFFPFMRTQIFDRLGMSNTRVDVATEDIPKRASFYFPLFGLAESTKYGPKPARLGDYSCYAGAAAFLSTPADLVKFSLAVNGARLLSRETVRVLQSPQRLSSGKEIDHGLGWDLETVSLAGDASHMVGYNSKGGFIGGVTSLMTFPERHLVVVVMANESYADTKSVALNIAQAFAAVSRKE